MRSATPENTADNCSKCRLNAVESSRAIVVLPVPGGPHRMMESAVRCRPCGPAGLRGSADDPAPPLRPGFWAAAGRPAGAARPRPGRRIRTGRSCGFIARARAEVLWTFRRASARARGFARPILRPRELKVPLHTEGNIIAGIAHSGQAAGIDVMGVLIAVFGEQAGPFGRRYSTPPSACQPSTVEPPWLPTPLSILVLTAPRPAPP